MNRPSASPPVVDSYVEGLGFAAVSRMLVEYSLPATRTGSSGGWRRADGFPRRNRATATIAGNLLDDLSVHHQTLAGKGAGFFVTLTDLDLDDTLVMNTSAKRRKRVGKEAAEPSSTTR